MIGQDKLQTKLLKYKELPRFMIFEGPKGCGKKTLAKELANKYSLNYIPVGLKMEDILSMIKIANNTTGNLFVIDKGNELSPNSENTLLKITEELPNNNYIILTCEMSILLLPTIISRGELFRFDDYTEKDFDEYLKLHNENYNELLANKYSLVYPNFSYLDLLSTQTAHKLVEVCNDLTIFGDKNEKSVVILMNKANTFNLNQFLYCLEKTCHSKILTSIRSNDKIIMSKLLQVMEIVSSVRKLLLESLVYNRNYITDYMALRIIEVNNQCK